MQHVVDGQQQASLDFRLREEDAIKGVLVQGRQVGDGRCMLGGDGEFAIAVLDKPAAQQVRIGLKGYAIQSALDGYFPNTGCTEPQDMLGGRQQVPGFARKALRFARGPEKHARVQKQMHFRPRTVR